MELVKNSLSNVANNLDDNLKGTPIWKVIFTSVGSTLMAIWLKDFLFQDKSIYDRTKKFLFRIAKKIPQVKEYKDKKISKISDGLQESMNASVNNEDYMQCLPKNGMSSEQVLKLADHYASYGKYKWKEGKVSGTVYNNSDELSELVAKTYSLTLWTNPLHADVFPGIRKMEAEIIRMCCNLFNGGPDSCGSVTSGGTESIILACKAYRDYAINAKGIKNPEILVPITAHAAFDKAAHLLNISIKHVPVDSKTYRVDPKVMRKHISRRTCVIVGSTPQFPHGAIDPIVELAELAVRYDIPLHVDACLGGFLVPFMNEAGFPIKPVDFKVNGVTSISCDTHKYGFSPKGSSVVLYSNSKIRQYQFFVSADWPGGIYATPTLAGSRPGGIVAATWASLLFYGRDGYIQTTKKIIEAARYIEQSVSKINGLKVVGKPEVSVVAFTSDSFNIYTLSDKMAERGWNLNALQYPSCIHIALTSQHTDRNVQDKFVYDLHQISAELLNEPQGKLEGSAALYGMAQSIPDRSIVSEVASAYIDCCYATAKSTTEKSI